MDHSLLMRRFQSIDDLPSDCQRLSDRKRASCDAIGERRPLDELEDESATAVGFFDAVNRGDVWMVQRRERACFTFEADHTVRIRHPFAGQDLDRDFAAKPAIAGAVDLSHPTGSEEALHLVATDAAADQRRRGEVRGGDRCALWPRSVALVQERPDLTPERII